MRIGGSIVLAVIGAVLYFAVSIDVAGVSLPTVGVILMIAGGVWFVVELAERFSGGTEQTATTGRSTAGRTTTGDGTADQRA